jgi:hypothetical protein
MLSLLNNQGTKDPMSPHASFLTEKKCGDGRLFGEGDPVSLLVLSSQFITGFRHFMQHPLVYATGAPDVCIAKQFAHLK